MTETPRYSSLGDYLQVLRRRRLLIAVITIGAFVLALGFSLTKSNVYVAETQLQFRDPLADLNIVGTSGETIPEISQNQRSALNAELLTRPEVTRRVEESLDTSVSSAGLSSSVDTRVTQQTNLVTLAASWGDAQFAADLANAYAAAARQVAIDDLGDRLDAAEDALRGQIRTARKDEPNPGAAYRAALLEQNLTQVRSLRDIAEPVQIAERAQVPGSPASPRPVRNGILGLVLGGVLALIVAFIRDSLDRRLHSAQEVHDTLGVPVLGRVGEIAFSYAGLAQNAGPAILESDFEPFRVLRMNLGHLAGDGSLRTVLVTSALAEEGKSTVSMSLASAAALAGQRVLLVEADLRRPSLARRMKIERAPGLSEYLAGNAEPADILQVVQLTEPRSVNGARPVAPAKGPAASMVCITAGGAVSTAGELLQSARFQGFLEKVAKAYDLVVIDGSPLLAVADPLEIIPHVHAVLICVRAEQTTHEQARAARSALGHVPERPAGAVLTGLHPGDDSFGYYYGY